MSEEAPELPSMAAEVARIAPPPPPSTQDDLDDLAEFGPRYTLKDIRQLRALKAFAVSGKVIDSCKAAGVKYSTWYRWIEEEPDFARALEHVKEILADDLEGVAMQRARDSSDTLLIALLKALKPDKYRDRQTVTVVSPDVISRLQRQADVILEVCKRELPEKADAARLASALANALREVWV